MIVASHQPLFFPWPGYLHKLARADIFILSDDVQFSKNNFQHRNRIVCAQTGRPRWLTVPVRYRAATPINQVEIGTLPDDDWRACHLRLLRNSYRRARHYTWLMPRLEDFYSRPYERLVDVSVASVLLLIRLLRIPGPLIAASSLGVRPPDRTDRLINMVRLVGGDAYLAGLGGSRTYLDEAKFKAAGTGRE